MSPRQEELIRAFVTAWQGEGSGAPRQPFVFAHDQVELPNWPPEVAVPAKEELRPLVQLGLLEPDRRYGPEWVVFPTPLARERFGTAADSDVVDALSDADRRLGVILNATVAAHEGDPSEPLHFASMDHGAYIDHPHWPIERDVVRRHDLAQLEDLGLLATMPVGEHQDVNFWPTPAGRLGVKNPSALLEQKAEQAISEDERSRLSRWAQRLRAGDFTVAAAAETASSVLIRALMGQ